MSERIRQPYATLAQRKASERTALILGICDGMEPAEVEKALRIGRAVLASYEKAPPYSAWVKGWNVARAHFLAAGDDE